MRRMFFAALVVMLSMTTGCAVVVRNPDTGLLHKVYPLGGTILATVYNRCSPMLHVEGDEDSVDIPYGESRRILLPVVIGQDRNDPKDVVMDAYTTNRKELGTRHIQLNSNYNSVLTSKMLVVGGRDADVQISGACGY